MMILMHFIRGDNIKKYGEEENENKIVADT